MKPGDLFADRYRIDSLLGAGGMGAVYCVTHRTTKRRAALKVIRTDVHSAELVHRFGREAELAGQLDTRHVVQVLDAGESNGTPYLVMELLQGQDLSTLLQTTGALTPSLAIRIASQCAAGLACAHERGIVHRDIKAANIFLASGEGDEVVVKVLDFGIAKLRKDPAEGPEAHALTRTGTLLGSPLYMSPEQALTEKDVDHRTDLWSLGIALYEMLSGRTPFHHHDAFVRLMMSICNEDAPPVTEFAPWVPPKAAAIVARLLRRDRGERFQSAAELRAELRALSNDDDSMSVHDLLYERASASRALGERMSDPSLGATLPLFKAQVQLTPGAAARSVPPHTAARRTARYVTPGVIAVSAIAVAGWLISATLLRRAPAGAERPAIETELSSSDLQTLRTEAPASAAAPPVASASEAASVAPADPPATVAPSSSARQRNRTASPPPSGTPPVASTTPPNTVAPPTALPPAGLTATPAFN